jgi:LysR family transcriptional regulator, hydrogen peroxide-inducible genes activator
MELQEIRYFLALSRTLNFTKAAEACHVSQPALTRAIHKIEDELGGLLFSRERNNTHATELGRLIEPQLAEIIAHIGEAKRTAERFVKLEDASLALGVMSTIAPVRFVNFLGQFKAENPGVQVKLLESVPDRLCVLLLEGKLDFALMARPNGFAGPLRALELYSEPYVIACSASHPFATKSHVPVSDLNGELYFPRTNCEFHDMLDEVCRDQGTKLVKSYQSEREDWILPMVCAGHGVSFLPESSVAYPGVVGCPVVSPSITRSVCLVTVAGRRRSPPAAAFVNAMRRYLWPTTSVSRSLLGHGTHFEDRRLPELAPSS